jgi:hypothetical protein
MNDTNKPSEQEMINDMLCTILGEVRSVRYMLQENEKAFYHMQKQLQAITNDILQLRMQNNAMSQPPVSQPVSQPASQPAQPPSNMAISGTEMAPPGVKWDKRDNEYPEMIFERPNLKIPNR